jgi:hypothetical protein
MNPCHLSGMESLANARSLIPAHPTAAAINPINIPLFMKVSSLALSRLTQIRTFRSRAPFPRE